MIRIILAGLFLILFLILTIPLMLITWLIGRIFPHAGDVSSLAIVNWGFRCLQVICGIKLKVLGAERVPKDTPVLYVANHRSLFDVVVTYPLVARPTGFISKKEILKVPLLNIWMALLHCLFLDRKDPRSGMNMILKAIELEKKGISVFVFPEGTRKRDYNTDDLLMMHNGSFKIATKAGVPIVPVAIAGTENIMAKHIPFVRSAKVTIAFGEPVDPKTLSKEELKEIGNYFGRILQDSYLNIKESVR